MSEIITKNLAETLAEVLPKAALLGAVPAPAGIDGLSILHYSVPKGSEVKELKIDLEPLLPNPRATRAHAKMAGPADFLAYVERHKQPRTMVWCDFNPQDFRVKFLAVFDEHYSGLAGWRRHTAELDPLMSAEWKVWKGNDKKAMPQIQFAEFIQEHDDNINSSDESVARGFPTSLAMLKMATEFVHNEERVLKSTTRLQSGGTRLTYVADADAGTTEAMEVFEKFQLGIPVFHGAGAWGMTARLKYRVNAGKVSFHYELVRADRVHESAARELIDTVKAGLGDVPMMFGACNTTAT